MPDDMTILLAGGGTGGHLYPGITVAQALREVMPEVRPLFLCTMREIDRVILEPTGFEFILQPIVPVRRNISGLLKFWRGWRETKDLVRKILRERKPVAVIGLGGYAAGVAVKLGAQAGLPATILNPDVIPGKANKYLMNYASVVCCGFEGTREHVSGENRKKLQITGCPIRADIVARAHRATAAGRLGLDPMLSTLVITGASLGAQTVNEAALATLPSLKLQGWQVLHLAGREHAQAVTKGYREKGMGARVIDFTPDMGDVWAVADLAISRAGASSVAELAACGVPAILMPYPYHKDMHQRANAKVLADAGAAVLMEDKKDARLNSQALGPILEPLLYDAAKRAEMAEAARKVGRPEAAREVAEVVRRCVMRDS